MLFVAHAVGIEAGASEPCTRGEDEATISEIRALGKKHGIQTLYYE